MLFPPAVAAAYRDVLVPLALVTTPNEPEARLLVGETTVDRRHTDGAVRARLATAIGDGAGGIAVVVTGGRSEHPGNGGTGNAVDVYYPGSGRPTQLIVGEWTDTANNAGTGDAFSASITAALARGLALDEAVVRAAAFVRAALTGGASWRLGAGPGPIDHLGWSAVPER